LNEPAVECEPLPPKFQAFSPIVVIAGLTLSIGTRSMSMGWSTSSLAHCGARDAVGEQISKPSPRVALSLLRICSLDPMPVKLILMPVFSSKPLTKLSGR